MIALRNRLATLVEWLAKVFERWGERLRVCPDCGENLFTGTPCV